MKIPTYASLTHGNESLEATCGSSLPKMEELKKEWDPKGVFGQWFPSRDIGADNMGTCIYEGPDHASQ